MWCQVQTVYQTEFPHGYGDQAFELAAQGGDDVLISGNT